MHFKAGENMNENKLLRQMKRGDTKALCAIIDGYAPYVTAIVSNIFGSKLGQEDIEETVSDVFYSLWRTAGKVQPGKLKAYLGAIARNTAKNKLRSLQLALPLEDDAIVLPDTTPGPEAEALQKELRQETRQAVDALPEPDREIMQRYYFLYQPTGEIARDMGLNSSTVTTKLFRSREKLRRHLEERGYSYEASHH